MEPTLPIKAISPKHYARLLKQENFAYIHLHFPPFIIDGLLDASETLALYLVSKLEASKLGENIEYFGITTHN